MGTIRDRSMAVSAATAVAMSAFVTAAAVVAAGVPFTMVVVTALEIGDYLKFALQKSVDDLIHIACRAADQLDPGFRQRHLRSSSDAAADQQIHAAFLQQPRQCSVSGLTAGQNPLRNDLAIFDREDRKFRRMPEMLEDFVVFTCDRDFHGISSCSCFFSVCFSTKTTTSFAADRF